MSARAHRRRNEDEDVDDEEEEEEEDNRGHMEPYRKRRRDEDRRKRKPDQFQLEREQKMARLRQEMRKEDSELAALDQKQQQLLREEAIRADEAKPQEEIIQVNPEELEGLDDEEQMRKLLGFDGFGSTKGEAVEDNKNSAARGVATKNKARKYRQYMNRKSGFNRPLEKMN